MTATATATNDFAQPSLSVFTVRGTQVATGDQLILDRPTHTGSHINTGAVYLHPSHTTYRAVYDPFQDRFHREAVHHHTVRYLDGMLAGLVDTVPEWRLIEYVTPEGYVGEL